MPVNPTSNSTPVRTNASTGPSTYTVQKGDSMSAIARRFGTTVQALVDANKGRYPTLATNPGNISVGWQLSIPGRGAATTPSAPPPAAPKSNDNVLLVGMNKGAAHEASELKKRANVTFVGDSFENDKVKTTDKQGKVAVHDLSTPAGATSFALTLGLPAAQTEKLAELLQNAGDDVRDELAGMAKVWAQAEKGGAMPSRLILSGHSVGDGVWGEDNGYLERGLISQLAEVMPKAARQVEDLRISGCYSGGESDMEIWRGIFPNVKTIWAYTGSAPGSYVGATNHDAKWEAATRGSSTALDRSIAKGTYKGDNVATWTVDRGYNDGRPPAPLAELRQAMAQNEGAFTNSFSGRWAVTDTQGGPLRTYYNQLQRVLQHPDLPAAERATLAEKRDVTIRLNFYSQAVAPKFAEVHKEAITKGFQALGMAVPDFGKLSRADALAQIKAFEDKAKGRSPMPADAARLLPLLTDGLRDLKPSAIPAAWV